MSSGSSDRARVQTRKGFDQSDVQQLMSGGNTLSSQNVSRVNTPNVQEQTQRTLFRGSGRRVGITRNSPFKGTFSSASREDVDQLLERFRARRQFISTKTQRPGITQLMTGGGQ